MFEGHVLVTQTVKDRRAHSLEQLQEGRVATKTGPQHNSVDEPPNDVLELRLRSTANRSADEEVRLSAVAVQQRFICSQQNDEEGDSSFLSERRQTLRFLAGDLNPLG